MLIISHFFKKETLFFLVIINVLLENKLLLLLPSQGKEVTGFPHFHGRPGGIFSPLWNVHLVTFTLYSLVFLHEKKNRSLSSFCLHKQ